MTSTKQPDWLTPYWYSICRIYSYQQVGIDLAWAIGSPSGFLSHITQSGEVGSIVPAFTVMDKFQLLMLDCRDNYAPHRCDVARLRCTDCAPQACEGLRTATVFYAYVEKVQEQARIERAIRKDRERSRVAEDGGPPLSAASGAPVRRPTGAPGKGKPPEGGDGWKIGM